ncbi:MAG: LysR family transcriptional regulator [Burkholderiales bacterium]|jgi:DNA-binding transcriptional LysR family regulator|nr:LysR family transcriptional regulator [Burkholderiales bacterium]
MLTAAAGRAHESPRRPAHFDLADLRLMVRIADTNSLTRAAEQVHISLPAASNRIKHLEQSVGSRLINRTSKGLTLTTAGEAMIKHARLILDQIEQLRGEMLDIAEGVAGRLRIMASTTAISEFLPAVIERYLAAHPGTSVDLRERLSSDIVRAVSEGVIDVGVILDNVGTAGLEVLPYRSDHMVLVVPDGHPLAGRRSVSFADTLDYDHVGLSPSSTLNVFLQQQAESLGRHINLRAQVGNFESLCKMVQARIGVGVLTQLPAARHARSMNIRIVELEDEWSVRPQYICVRSLAELPSFARIFVDMLRDDGANAARPASAD